MHIVTDSGVDLGLSTEEQDSLRIRSVPLTVTLDDHSYREGVDIGALELYALLEASGSLPTTSQPAPGTFADVYRELAVTDPAILSIHISSGLSGTLASAQLAAASVPEADVTFVDAKTLSVAAGWQVAAAAKANRAGWTKERILALLERIREETDIIYTLKELKYLIHGGRISHMKGLIASVLNLKPLIGVEKVRGTYVQLGQARSLNGAIEGLVDLVARKHRAGSALRVQVGHANAPESADLLQKRIGERFQCQKLPAAMVSLVLGAHTGPSLIGVAYAPRATFEDVPA
jgi:DegV family protein with EDD domain